MKNKGVGDSGFTIIELIVAIVVIGMIVIALFGLYIALVQSAVLTKRKAAALTLATNQVEYLKSLPYNSLAIAGGSIVATNPLPASFTQTLSGVKYTVKTDISYVDDAFDGCGSYPTQQLKQTYCRNYPPPVGAPALDQNPADYKIVHVAVYDASNKKLTEVGTEISARVAETASNTGALFVKIIDNNGNPVSGATVQVTNTFLSPSVNVSDSTDTNGEAIFYGLPPDVNTNHYIITGSLGGYSTLVSIAPSGALQPNYPDQKILSQQSSNLTLTLKQQGSNSLLIQTTDVNNNPLANAKIYVKGGYKKYTSNADTQYYFDTLSPSDVRPVSDSNGLVALSNLVPAAYIFCGDLGATSCSIGGTTYYLAAAVPYGGSNPLQPIVVPTYDPSNPPATTFNYNGTGYLQEVRLMLTTNASFPRVSSLSPSDVSLAGSLTNIAFNITGVNIPCNAVAGSCTTQVSFLENSTSYPASCTGVSGNSQQTLSCTVTLTGVTAGNTQLVVKVGANTLTLPATPLLGGLIVTP